MLFMVPKGGKVKAYIVGAQITIRYWCEHKPLAGTSKKEPLNDYVTMEIPLTDITISSDPCGRYDDAIEFTIRCPACGRHHNFDLMSIEHNNKGLKDEPGEEGRDPERANG